MPETITFRRVLIVADESADWIVAGLRQLDRLALSVDEFAVENNETSPVHICIHWRPNLDPLLRRVPKHKKLTRVAFTADLDGSPYDLVLSTRLFLYRKAMRQLIEASIPATAVASSGEMDFWMSTFHQANSLPRFREQAWDYITDENQIDEVERRFLLRSGKSQDGLVSRYLNRPISRRVTRLLLRFPITPNRWTLLIFPIPIVATLILFHGTSGSFVWGLILFQVFSVLDGCDGEIARAKFLESERGRRLDDLFDILSNVLLVIGLGFGLSRQANLSGHFGWFWAAEGIAAAVLIGANEFYLAMRETRANNEESDILGGALYPRHRHLVERSGMLGLSKRLTHWVMQLTKRDVSMLGFVLLAFIGRPALILHLMFVVTAITLTLAVRARRMAAL